MPPCREKNEHTLDNLRGKCPLIVSGFFFHSHGIIYIEIKRCAALSHTPALPLPHLFIYMVAANASLPNSSMLV